MKARLMKCLREVYQETNTPADAITTSVKRRKAFAKIVRARLGQPQLLTDEVMRQLLRMRKRGGLPRLRK